MSLAGRIILGTAAVTSFAMLVAAALVHWVVRAYLSPFAEHFAMMRRMMGWGPDLETIYGLVDHSLAISLGIAVFLGVLAGLLVAQQLARSVAILDQGLARFSRGLLDQPIPLAGPPELARVAASANHMAEELGAAQRAERELVAGIAHDLAHPLTAMRGTVEAVRDGLTSPSDPRTMARLLTDVGTMETTLGDLRDVAAAEVGVLRLELRDIDVAAVVGRIAASYADLAARKGIRLELETGIPAAVVARTDERRLARIVANLVVNALQATPPGGQVSVRLSARDGVAMLHVEDSAGPNAGAAIRAALDGQGSGLGLRVVRVLGRAIGAQLTVRDGEAGASVELRLPR